MKKYPYRPELSGPSKGIGNFVLTNPLVKMFFSWNEARGKKFPPILKTTKTLISVKGYGNVDLPCYVIEPDLLDANAPSIVYFHGGGFFGGFSVMHFQNACFYANELKCKVFLPEYRTSYQNKFPIPVEDCYEATKYICHHAKELQVNLDRLIVYGDSAGGCLAAAVAILTRDRKEFSISYQMLIYPVTDYLQQGESLKKYPDATWSTCANRQMWDLYLDHQKPENIGYASPLHALDLRNLPPAYVEPQEIDCLCDDGIAYAKRLEESGVNTTLNVVKGSYHAFEEEYPNQFVIQILRDRSALLRASLPLEKK